MQPTTPKVKIINFKNISWKDYYSFYKHLNI
jgi:hypothetical protein